MAKAQGDKFKTWTDTEMNKRVSEYEKKWEELIKPYYDSLVNDTTKEYQLEETEESKVIIRTRQLNDVECTGKTKFWLGTLKKEDYKVVNTTYIIEGLTVDKLTGQETRISYQMFEGKNKMNEANEAFKALKQYLG